MNWKAFDQTVGSVRTFFWKTTQRLREGSWCLGDIRIGHISDTS